MAYKVIYDYIPVSSNGKRPGKVYKKSSITVHNTDNPRSTGKNERDNLARKDNYNSASFNIVIYHDEVRVAIPTNEISHHCGVAEGNKYSISIEICDSGDTNWTDRTAAEYIADLLKANNWSTDRVKTHKYWNGKNCPRRLLPEWNKFIAEINKNLGGYDMDKIVLYYGDGDLFAAILVSQKYNCPLMRKSDFDKSGLKAKEIMTVGGKSGTNRFDSFKDAAKLV